MIISAELAPVFVTCLERYKTIEYYTEWLAIFREEMHTLMKTWGTFQEFRQMELVFWEEGVEKRRPYPQWTDPNLFNESNMLGMNTDGFIASFKTPSQETVTVRFYAVGQRFEIR